MKLKKRAFFGQALKSPNIGPVDPATHFPLPTPRKTKHNKTQLKPETKQNKMQILYNSLNREESQ